MLPLERPWYRRLLLLALLLGGVGGLLALLFNGITGAGIDLFFGGSGTGLWTGQWWWIPLTALGGLIVAFLRKIWKVPEDVPSPIKLAHVAWVDPQTALPWVLISAVSLIAGASLGPFFGFAVMGGGLGSWLVTRLEKPDEEEAKHEYTLTGMAGTMGAAFTSPLFAAILASELSPTEKRNYVTAFIPALFAATLGFIVYFGVTGSTMLGRYQLPPYESHVGHLLIAVFLGIMAAFILILFGLIKKLVSAAFSRIPNPLVGGAIGGALVGLLAFALPLTATSGSSQLTTELEISATLGTALVAAILIAKMFAIALSQSSGFLGGVVFPIIFVSGTAGVLVNSIFPQIPIALSVGALLAAVPGAFLGAPVSLILIAAATVGLGEAALVPVCIAVVTSHLTLALVRNYIVRQRTLKMQEDQ
jgi:H+/Cl- antiporter ClcA